MTLLANEKTHYHKDYPEALVMIKASVHPYLVGPSGCGKTTLARQIATELNLPFYYSGAVESAFQLRGFKDAHGNVARTPFRDAYQNGGVFLFDELDASNPNSIVSLHAALDNGVLDAPDGMVPRHKDFHYIAAANTWGHGATLEYMGRNALDGATLDRYAFLPMDYDEDLERELVAENYPDQTKWPVVVQQARAAVRDLKIRHVISPRASFDGARLLQAGIELTTVFSRTVVKGMSKHDVEKVRKKIDFDATELKNKATKQESEAEKLAKLLVEMPDSINKANALSQNAADLMRQVVKLLDPATQSIEEITQKIVILKGLQASAASIIAAAQQQQGKLEGIVTSVPAGP